MHINFLVFSIAALFTFSGCSDANLFSSMFNRNNDKGGNNTPADDKGTAPGDLPLDPNAPRGDTSYMPVDSNEPFADLQARLASTKDDEMTKQLDLLATRYDLSDNPMSGVAMTRGKAIQQGPATLLPSGETWQSLSAKTPAEIRAAGIFPNGFKPLPHARTAEGGQVLPQFHIDEIIAQDRRDLTRFDVEFDLPDHFIPEPIAGIFLTTRPDLGDVSQGVVVTRRNFFELFDGVLTPKQIDGLRLLLEPLPQQQFNLTSDRRTDEPHEGIACFDCHVNGHTNAAFHLDPQTRPQASRRRIETPSLRGINIQRLLGSQRALRSVEDFTEFEQRAAYFDGDIVTAIKKGMRPLERGSEVANMGEFQALLDFPPAPKLNVSDNKLDPSLATASELRGQDVFFGKGQCANCHVPPFYTDNEMHDLHAERFFAPENINGRYASTDGPIKTFPLRGIKDSPPYLHDGRLLTLADTVEFFNLILAVNLTDQEKKDLVDFMLAL